ncbi:LacI family DNA-binding transcriptional regulator [Streptomyces thermodiastaticus]|uniref:LacI family DNA-binding transcriptional regulator n=1 Tax=Streptomyces thermodiastaticus TaxID=44061 RepID=UPI0019C7B699|nr:LacI family DNA-binding transcriptional regulator [Streptomyces thermodiastaticus]MCE7548956.1 LacI family transcriptional regulator [Streptomyces thermodiastaticus]GHF75607.1 LacI family transcriptional regulator [Streptomyces thermodiastaticus]
MADSFSGSGSVAEETRARVQAALDELGYRPNLAARNLRAGRTGLIGLVIPELHSPYFGELAGLLVEAAQQRSWTVVIDQTFGDGEAERRLLEGTGGRMVDGLIISPWSLRPDELTARARDIPVVLLGEQRAPGLADRVAVDNVLAADEATTHLLDTGRRRIAAIGLQPHLHNDTARQRLEGYHRALRRAGLPSDEALQRTVQALHREDGARAMAELLDSGARPDAVFAFTDELALGALHVAHARGLRVPDDLAVVRFDGIEDGRYAYPPLTTVVPDKKQIAERALQCLADRIYSPAASVPPSDIVVPHRLEVRDSSRPAG